MKSLLESHCRRLLIVSRCSLNSATQARYCSLTPAERSVIGQNLDSGSDAETASMKSAYPPSEILNFVHHIANSI